MQMVTAESHYIVSKDERIFRKFYKQDWSTVRSLQAMKVDYITEIEIKIISGYHLHFGFTKKIGETAATKGVWQTGYSYGTGYNLRCKSGTCIHYEIEKSQPGDKLKFKIDLRKGRQNFQVFKNDRSLGIFFSGLDLEVPLYFAISPWKIGHSFEILSKKEYKQ